ncbi:MAG: NEAT domain-containing protein, partial [Sporomusa sp.]
MYCKRSLAILLAILMILAILPITALAEGESLDKDNLADGTYTIEVAMRQVTSDTASMSDNAIDHTATLTVEDGQYYVTLTFKGMMVLGSLGYLGNLNYYDQGFTRNQYGGYEGTVIQAEVLSTQKDENGNDIYDDYNTGGNPYPEKVKFPLVNQANFEDDAVPLQVFVPIMEAIAAGNGTQSVRMIIDWDTLTLVELDEDPVTVDKTALNMLFQQANGYQSNDYSEASYSTLQMAILFAQYIYNNEMTQEQVGSA